MQYNYPQKQNPTLYALNAVAEQYARNGTGLFTGFTGGYTVQFKVNPSHPRYDVRINLAPAQGFVGGPVGLFNIVCAESAYTSITRIHYSFF